MAQDGEYEYDLVTIGSGSGGTRASRFSAQNYGAKVAVLELPFGYIATDEVGGAGGTCVIRGCVPKKLLVYGSEFAEEFEDSEKYGWSDVKPSHRWQTLVANKAKEIKRLNGVYNSLLKSAGVERIEGWGSLIDAHTVEVKLTSGGIRKLTTKNILIATGSKAQRIPIEGAEYSIISDDALSLDSFPEAPIVIVGAGYIACEFANIYRGLGGDIHQIYRGDKLLRGFDEECRLQVFENMKLKGINLHPSCKPVKIEKHGEKSFVVHYEDHSGRVSTINCGLVLFATGRKPRTAGMNLQEIGVELDDQGAVKVDEVSRSNVPNVWAIGDVTNRINLTPVALVEAMCFAKTCFGNQVSKPDYRFVASAVFCQPPLSTVGYTEDAAVEELSGDIDVYVSKFRPLKSTVSGREQKTIMKIIVHSQSDKVVGCHMVGPEAAEIMQGLAIALKCGATKTQFDSTVAIHPTQAEEFVTMRTKSRSRKCTGSIKL